MSFSLDSNNDEVKSDYPKGVFVDLLTITKVDNSKSQYTDLSIFVEGEAERAKYPKKFFLSGNHLKEKGKATDWGSSRNEVKNGSWKIAGFLKSAGITTKKGLLDAEGQLSQETLRDLIGRTLYVLQYESTGKYSRETWFFFGSEDGGKEYLLEKWKSMKTPPNSYKHQSSNKKLNTIWDEMPKEEDVNKKKEEVELPF